MLQTNRLKATLSVLASYLFVAACGGGGGSNTSTNSQTIPSTTPLASTGVSNTTQGSTASTSSPTPSSGSTSITSSPANVIISKSFSSPIGVNGTITFTAAYQASPSSSIQWRKNGVVIPGATQSSYSHQVTTTDANAVFDVLISDPAGSTSGKSEPLSVVIAPAPENMPDCHTKLALATTGTSVSKLQPLEDAVRAYMLARQTPAATLTVRNNGVVIYERGFGWQDLTCTQAMPYQGLFRSASLSKPVTASAVQRLISDGKLSASDKVFCTLGQTTNCILDFTGAATLDSRAKDITVQNLLDHRSGWDHSQISDPLFDTNDIAQTLGLSTVPTQRQVALYMLTQKPLQHSPGTVTAYSNFGYSLLGMVIAQRTGLAYETYVQNNLLSALGISKNDFKLSRSLVEDRDNREPWYSDPRWQGYSSVFDQSIQGKFPEVGVAYEQWAGAISWVFSGRDYTRFMANYGLKGLASRDNSEWHFIGTMPGTYNLAITSGTLDIVYLSNQRQLDLNGLSDNALLSTIQNAMQAIATWPTSPPAGHAP